MTTVHEDYAIPLGGVVTDAAGARWVFVGYHRTTMNYSACFIKELQGEIVHEAFPYRYRVVYSETFTKKFNGTEQYRRSL